MNCTLSARKTRFGLKNGHNPFEVVKSYPADFSIPAMTEIVMGLTHVFN